MGLLVLLALPLSAQLGHNDFLTKDQQIEYYRLASLLSWSQFEVAQQDLVIRDEMAKRVALYQESVDQMRAMQQFQASILAADGCTIIKERAQVKCQGEPDGSERQTETRNDGVGGIPDKGIKEGNPNPASQAPTGRPVPPGWLRHQKANESRGEEKGTGDQPR